MAETIVSIVMPVHVRRVDELGWLREALDSALAQTIPCEVVAWDDGSPLNVGSVRRDYPTVGWHRFDENRGVVAARNAAVEAARGPWILPLDHDDQLEPEAAATLLNALEGRTDAFAYSDLHFFGPGVEMLYETYDFDLGLLLRLPYVSVSALYPKEAWERAGGYDPRFERGFEDWAFAVSLALAGYQGVRVQRHRPLLWYRFRPGARRKKLEPHKAELLATFQSVFSEALRAHADPRLRARPAAEAPPPHQPPPGAGPTAPPMRGTADAAEGNVRYLGPSKGMISVYGWGTKTYYSVSANSPILKVAPEDYARIVSRSDFEPYREGGR